VTAELNVQLEDPVSTQQSGKSFTTPMIELQLLNLLLLKTTLKGKKYGVLIIKPGWLIIGNT
jgi:hypothetical protein